MYMQPDGRASGRAGGTGRTDGTGGTGGWDVAFLGCCLLGMLPSWALANREYMNTKRNIQSIKYNH